VGHGSECLAAAAATSEAGIGIALGALCVGIMLQGPGLGSFAVGEGVNLIHQGVTGDRHRRKYRH
jgi:hypothetical protein